MDLFTSIASGAKYQLHFSDSMGQNEEVGAHYRLISKLLVELDTFSTLADFSNVQNQQHDHENPLHERIHDDLAINGGFGNNHQIIWLTCICMPPA